MIKRIFFLFCTLTAAVSFAGKLEDFADEFEYNTAMYPNIQMRVLQRVLGIQNKFVPIDIIVTSLDGVDFSDVIMEGEIDLAALDAVSQ